MARTDPQFNLRVPQELKQQVEDAAKESGRSINAEAVYRLEESFLWKNNFNNIQADVRIILLPNGKKRLIYGKLLNILDLDYTQLLSNLKRDIEVALDALSRSTVCKPIQFLTKEVAVIQGNNHLDIVDSGKKSLAWLVVEDYIAD